MSGHHTFDSILIPTEASVVEVPIQISCMGILVLGSAGDVAPNPRTQQGLGFNPNSANTGGQAVLSVVCTEESASIHPHLHTKMAIVGAGQETEQVLASSQFWGDFLSPTSAESNIVPPHSIQEGVKRFLQGFFFSFVLDVNAPMLGAEKALVK